TVAQVYQQINQDLDEAINLLDGFNRSSYISDLATAKSHINKNVAQGIKARVALAQQEWDIAAQNAQAARQGFALMSNTQYTSGFNDATNTEWIWGSHQIVDHNTFFWSFFANMGCNFNGTNTRTQPKAINSSIYNALPDTDIRKKVFSRTGAEVPIPPGGARIPFQSMKFLAAGEALSIGDVPMMRAAEMLLIEAEVLVMFR
ncbi:MAG: RagB/SusD family nutrient uptake outer membrane protein, partial [Chitinophagaceae bacterium]|nr:RagB/SusD family nutrient uptake outer membrane protein [Chitinophagaceae bacterium]